MITLDEQDKEIASTVLELCLADKDIRFGSDDATILAAEAKYQELWEKFENFPVGAVLLLQKKLT